MADGFYLANIKYGKADGTVGEDKNVLFFRQDKSGYDNKATKEQVKIHAALYGAFKAANPNFKLPWGDENTPILQPGETIHSYVGTPGLKIPENEKPAPVAELAYKEGKPAPDKSSKKDANSEEEHAPKKSKKEK